MTTLSATNESSERHASRRERCAWINLAVTVAVYVPYFSYVVRLLQRGEYHAEALIGPFLGAVIGQIALTIVGVCIFAAPIPREPKDERDFALENRSLRGAYYVLAALGFTFMVMVPVIYSGSLIAHGDARFVIMFATQVFLLCFVVAEAIRCGVLAFGYRRGY